VFLTLEITSGPAFEQLPARQHTFGIEGGSIGRTAGNEWVIPHEFVHREHASVRFFNGLFFIEKRGQNLVAVNSPERDLPTGDSYPVRDGDKLFIDEFEISVRITAQPPPPPVRPQIAPPPLTAAPSQRADDVTGSRFTSPPSPLIDFGGDDGEDDLDKFLRNLTPEVPVARARSQEVNSSAAIHDRIDLPMNSPRSAPPPPSAPPPAGGGSMLADGWDKTSFSFNPPANPPAAAPPPPRYPEPARAAPPPPSYPPPPAYAPPPAYSPPPAARAAAPTGELAALLAQAGIDPSLLMAGEVEMIGRALRGSLAGIIRVLQVRSEMRARFRVTDSRTATGERNPLKAAANLDDALHEFFRRRGPDSLPLDQAVDRAMEEVDCHQGAMLDAMKAAFGSMLERFDPAAIEEEAERTGRRSALVGRAGRLWETYEKQFRTIAGDKDEAFRKLFAADFARAYEEALESRRTGARNQRQP
jgi:type VI secretion system FHA domain protein